MTVPPTYPDGHALLDHRVVVVTAAAGTGIGFATAKRCAEEGATVVLSDHHARRLDEAADALAAERGVRPLTVVCDVTRDDQVQALVDTAAAEHGGVDVMVNNAGLGGTVDLVDMTDEQWRNVLVPWSLWITPQDEIWTSGSSPTLAFDSRGMTGIPPSDQAFMRLNSSGKLLELWCPRLGVDGQEKPGETNWVHALAADSKGNLYAGDIRGHRVQKFVRVR